jgi:hypothetical protein
LAILISFMKDSADKFAGIRAALTFG